MKLSVNTKISDFKGGRRMEKNANERKTSTAESLNEKFMVCEVCGKGILRPFKPEAKINHSYICDYCGANVHYDPLVIVE
jgi:predicted RNA-binding Zn-ribbon protein involved in translation (DUF1610 family)